MIVLYRESNSHQADAIEAEFKELALGYDCVVIGEKEVSKLFGAEYSLPLIKNNERLVSGEESIAAYIKELEQLMRDWQLFQGDFCYVDEDGDVC
jgi:hypothetical protein